MFIGNDMSLLVIVSRLWDNLPLLFSKDLKEGGLILYCSQYFASFNILLICKQQISFFSGFKHIRDFLLKIFVYDCFRHKVAKRRLSIMYVYIGITFCIIYMKWSHSVFTKLYSFASIKHMLYACI